MSGIESSANSIGTQHLGQTHLQEEVASQQSATSDRSSIFNNRLSTAVSVGQQITGGALEQFDAPPLERLNPAASADRREPLVPKESSLPKKIFKNVMLAGKGIIAVATVGISYGVSYLLGRMMRENVFGSEADRREPNQIGGHQDSINSMGNAGPMECLTADNEKLRGNFFSPADSTVAPGTPDTRKPVVLLLSGSGGTAENYGREIADFYSKGSGHKANVMSLNYRGFGESDGGLPSKQSVYQDAHAMFNKLLDMGFEPNQIVIHGFSLGGSVAAKLHESAENQGMQLKGVVYDRPMTSVKEAATASMGGGVKGWIAGPIAGPIGAWGAGSMDARSKLREIQTKTPVIVTYDNQNLGPNARTMGNDLRNRLGEDNVKVLSTNSSHLDSSSMVWRCRTDLNGILV